MERQTDLGRDLGASLQQSGGVIRRGAELAGQVVDGLTFRHGQTHHQRQIGGVAGLGQDLVQLGEAVEHEVAHAIVEIGRADGGARLDRMHEMDRRVRHHRTHLADFGHRSGVEMGNAAIDEMLEHLGVGIAFHSIQHVAGKAVEEGARLLAQLFGAGADHRHFGLEFADDVNGGLFELRGTRGAGNLLNEAHLA